MSGREKWMPSLDLLGSMSYFQPVREKLDAEFRRTGIRAQIAALEEMESEFGPPDGLWTGECPDERIWVRQKLSALYKELA